MDRRIDGSTAQQQQNGSAAFFFIVSSHRAINDMSGNELYFSCLFFIALYSAAQGIDRRIPRCRTEVRKRFMGDRPPGCDVRFGTLHEGRHARGLKWAQGFRPQGAGLFTEDDGLLWRCRPGMLLVDLPSVASTRFARASPFTFNDFCRRDST